MSVNVQRGARVSTMATWRLRSREISFRVGAGIFTAAGTFIVNALLLGYGRCLWGLALALGPRFLLRGGAKSITPADTEGPGTVAAEPVCRDNSSGNGIKYLKIPLCTRKVWPRTMDPDPRLFSKE